MKRFVVGRVAEVRLRGRAGSLRARAYWPSATDSGALPALLLFFPGSGNRNDELCGCLCSLWPMVVLSLPTADLTDATTAMEWVADHGAELGADPAQLHVGGEGAGANLAAAVAMHALDQGWPPLRGHILINPDISQLIERTA